MAQCKLSFIVCRLPSRTRSCAALVLPKQPSVDAARESREGRSSAFVFLERTLCDRIAQLNCCAVGAAAAPITII